jgi:predicted HicB family RNase H-like nuclease
MKRLIDGVTYNTETATLLARSEGEWGEWAKQEDLPIVETLYQTRSGNFFMVEEITTGENEDGYSITKYRFAALNEKEARKWMVTGEAEVFLNPFEEKVDEDETEGTIYARIPASLKRKIEEAAKSEGLSANSWAMRCFERCLGAPAAE